MRSGRAVIRVLPALVALAIGVALAAVPSHSEAGTAASPVTSTATHTLYDFSAKRIDGVDTALAAFRGKVVLVVNTASHCGFTKQYAALEALQKRYESRGFTVLGFPANDFLWQERGSDADIQKFCSLKYDVTFPMFSKIHVKGGHIDPLYAWLTRGSDFPGNISWNFTKFVIGPDGRVAARFSPSTTPDDSLVIAAIERQLAAR